MAILEYTWPEKGGRSEMKYNGKPVPPMLDMNRYCYKCGMMLNKYYSDMRFDVTTGDPDYNILWQCPMWSKWHIFDRHLRFKSDRNGSSYAFEI